MALSHKVALRGGCAALALTALAGCTIPPPSGPHAVAMPPAGKSYELFIQEESYCRQAAAYSVGPGPSDQQATNQVVGSAVVGTAIGAAAGAAIGSASGHVGGGAAVGGALGALTGTAVGASNASNSAYGMQQRYDITYAQCMVSKGNTVQMPPQPVYAPYPAYYEPYGPYFYYGHPRYWR
jgi:hypothetical protein